MTLNIPLKLNLKDGGQTIAIVGDYHYPFHDPKTITLVDKFLEELQPNQLIYNGDIADFYQVSVFAKDPGRVAKLQEDIKMVTDMFKRHKKMLPKTRRILNIGTHEYRFQKFLWSKAGELASLDCLSVEELYQLEKNSIQSIPFEQGLLINGVFLIIHGSIVSIHSAYTAKRQFEKQGGCGICNHTHRLGSFFKRDRFGTWGWWENGCVCSLDPDWIQNPHWQQGFSLVHFTDHKRFWVESIPIINHKFLYGEKLYA